MKTNIRDSTYLETIELFEGKEKEVLAWVDFKESKVIFARASKWVDNLISVTKWLERVSNREITKESFIRS